jgi:hypothetical protein
MEELKQYYTDLIGENEKAEKFISLIDWLIQYWNYNTVIFRDDWESKIPELWLDIKADDRELQEIAEAWYKEYAEEWFFNEDK